MAIAVYLSVGKTFRPEQEQFVTTLENFLRARDFEPHTLGRSEWKNQAPLKPIKDRMLECSGTVIIAFERVFIESGFEYRGSDAVKVVKDQKVPTVWNQIEPAMAYTLGHPLFVIVEKGTRIEGLLERHYDWWVQEADIGSGVFQTAEFLGVFSDWATEVKASRETKASGPLKSQVGSDPDKLTIGAIVKGLTTQQIWSMSAAILGALIAIATISYHLGLWVGGLPKH
jgi:hypothetical protein